MTHTLHLTESQIDDQLLGDLSPEASLHLASCAHCTARIAESAAPFTHFREVSAAWSERRSATLPLRPLSYAQPVWQRRLAVAAAAIGVFALSLNGYLHRDASQQTPQPAIAHAISAQPEPLFQLASTGPVEIALPSEQSRRDDIVRDNQMLQAIDTALGSSEDTPADLGLVPVGNQRTQPPADILLND